MERHDSYNSNTICIIESRAVIGNGDKGVMTPLDFASIEKRTEAEKDNL